MLPGRIVYPQILLVLQRNLESFQIGKRKQSIEEPALEQRV